MWLQTKEKLEGHHIIKSIVSKIKVSNTLPVFVIYSILLASAYVWGTFKPDAPFMAFATHFTLGFAAYVGKRLIQKRKEFREGLGDD